MLCFLLKTQAWAVLRWELLLATNQFVSKIKLHENVYKYWDENVKIASNILSKLGVKNTSWTKILHFVKCHHWIRKHERYKWLWPLNSVEIFKTKTDSTTPKISDS